MWAVQGAPAVPGSATPLTETARGMARRGSRGGEGQSARSGSRHAGSGGSSSLDVDTLSDASTSASFNLEIRIEM